MASSNTIWSTGFFHSQMVAGFGHGPRFSRHRLGFSFFGKEEMGWKRSHNPVGTQQAEFFFIYRWFGFFFFHVMLFGGIVQPLPCPSTVRLWMNKLFVLSNGLQKRLLRHLRDGDGHSPTPSPALAPFVLPKANKNSTAINFSSTRRLGMASLNPNHLVFI